MLTIRRSRPEEGERVIEIWRSAVDATHGFLAPEDRLAMDRCSPVDGQGRPFPLVHLALAA